MEKSKIMLKTEKVDDINYYMPVEKMCYSLANFFSLFADCTRIKILSALSMSEMCVGDISKILDINQTTVSHQLKLLKSGGMVKFRRDGKVIYYSISSEMVNECLLSAVEYLQKVEL